MKKKIICLTVLCAGIPFLFILLFASTKTLNAQETSFGISNSLPIAEKTVNDGDIITVSEKGYTLSKMSYDPSVIGIVSLNPAIAITIEGIGKTYPVITFGNANVRVSTTNGTIKKGDLITSSAMPGIGMKADKSGYVIGSALQDFDSNNPNEIGKIAVALNVYYFYSKLFLPKIGIFDILKMSSLATYEQPSLFLKYLVALIILLISIVFGFFSFARSASKGIEALGRNPLAGKSIQLGMLINALISIAIIAAGMIIAYVVITS